MSSLSDLHLFFQDTTKQHVTENNVATEQLVAAQPFEESIAGIFSGCGAHHSTCLIGARPTSVVCHWGFIHGGYPK